MLRGFNFCVIDEVDSILIDEARTPLIISGSAEKPSERYIKASKIASAFQRDYHYTVRSFSFLLRNIRLFCLLFTCITEVKWVISELFSWIGDMYPFCVIQSIDRSSFNCSI